jgi:hypothetical protein
MTADLPLRFAIGELSFALDEIETHWDAMESLLRAHLDLVKSQPTDPRILSGDYTREEIGDDASYIQHEINALVKNRDLIREKYRLLRAALDQEIAANPNSSASCCPGEHTLEEGRLAAPRTRCSHEICSCICHTPGNIILHDRACCDVCRTCGLRAVAIYKSL